MLVRSFSSTFVRSTAACVAVAAALTLSGASLVFAQDGDESRTSRRHEPIVFTVDVAEDLAGKFVPTFVKPTDTQPERGSGGHHPGRRRGL
jgi:hypothetical protein